MISYFNLEDRHREQREIVREFCETEIKPRVERYERDEAFPRELIERVGEAGFAGVPYPATYGGTGLDYRSFAVTVEELARGWKHVAGTVNIACGLVGYPIYEFGTDWQCEEWLTPILKGEWIAALALTEPEAGSDVASLSTTAELADDEYVLDGHKVWTTNGSEADFIVVAARTVDERGEGSGHEEISLFGVPNPWDCEGIEHVRDIPCMEGGAAVESEIKFDGVRVPAENAIGETGQGFRYVMEGLDVGRIGTAAQGVGLGQAALEASRRFADEREQFGRPIREFQGVSFKIADMAIEIEAARLLTLHAAAERDRNQRITKEAAMAKTKATDAAMDATAEAVQIHGSRGYSRDYPLERYMREAKGMQIYEGTNEINRVVVADRLYD